MKEPVSIKRQSTDPFHLDFEELKKEGVAALQSLCGNIWTDYNEHDPGVTILEQLCFVITELSYRAGFEVNDLLADENGRLDERKNALLTPATVLPSAPVTINDYRKILLDRIPQLQNIWMRPAVVSGLYKVMLLPDASFYQSTSSESELEEIRDEVVDVFNRNRAMGEQLQNESVKVTKKEPFTVHAQVIVRSHKSQEQVLAEIIVRIRNYLNPIIPRRTLDELENLGMLPADIYEGPVMKKGYILDEDLKPKLTKVNVADLVKLIIAIPEVESVSYLQLEGFDQFGDEIAIPEYATPDLLYTEPLTAVDARTHLLRTGENQANRALTVKLLKSSNETYFALNEEDLRQAIHLKKASLGRGYSLNTESSGYSSLPDGQYHNLGAYHSIQHDFPSFYAINEFGVGNGTPNSKEEVKAQKKRRGEANQLKGYLVIFEQLIANYLAQLKGLKTLFSTDLSASQSYFTQVLDKTSIPNVYPLYSGTVKPDEEVLAEYQSKLDATVEEFDDAEERRSRFLDHLLALYGESFSQDSLYRFNYLYYSAKQAEYQLNINKLKFLQNIVRVTRNRASASDFLSRGTGFDKEPYRGMSGAELKVHLLLGLELPDERSSIFRSHLRVFAEQGIKLERKGDMTSDDQLYFLEKLNSTLYEGYIEKNAFDIEAPEELPSDELQKELLEEIQIKKYGRIDDKFLRAGIALKDYKVCLDELSERYHLLFLDSSKNSDHSHWLNLGSFESVEKANMAGFVVRELLVELNTKSEGFHMIEHQLLRPENREEQHDFETESVPVNFYDHQVSVVLPNWSARFHDKAFQKLVDETFAYSSPAHIYTRVFWLDPTEMLEFEQRYAEWLTDKASRKRMEHLEMLRREIILIIKNHSNS